jgi:hypothetical protein
VKNFFNKRIKRYVILIKRDFLLLFYKYTRILKQVVAVLRYTLRTKIFVLFLEDTDEFKKCLMIAVAIILLKICSDKC